jgi:hypothetical protein
LLPVTSFGFWKSHQQAIKNGNEKKIMLNTTNWIETFHISEILTLHKNWSCVSQNQIKIILYIKVLEYNKCILHTNIKIVFQYFDHEKEVIRY